MTTTTKEVGLMTRFYYGIEYSTDYTSKTIEAFKSKQDREKWLGQSRYTIRRADLIKWAYELEHGFGL